MADSAVRLCVVINENGKFPFSLVNRMQVLLKRKHLSWQQDMYLSELHSSSFLKWPTADYFEICIGG